MKVRRQELGIAAGVGLSALALVYAMLASERTTLHHALQIAAPREALPGSSLPIRGYVMEGIEVGENPTLIDTDIEVRLTVRPSADGEPLATMVLSHTATHTSEGTLTVPDAPGTYVLEARATSDGTVLASVAQELVVDPEAAPAIELGRLAPALSQFALGPIVIEANETPPTTFDVRIGGGLCVPDQRCSLLVDVGSAGLDVRVEPGPAVTVLDGASREGRYASLPVQVSGSEGELTLIVSEAGRVLCRRSVRLPVALATPLLHVPEPFVREGRLAIEVAAPPGRTELLADLARDGHFVRSFVLPATEPDARGVRALDLALPDLTPGLYRLQLRADPFPTERVTSRMIRVGTDAPPPFDATGPLAFAFAAADLEGVGLVLPPMVSGLEGDRARIEAGQSIVRAVALAAMLVAGVLLVLAILRRGMASDANANQVLRDAGVEESAIDTRHQRVTLALTVLSLALAILTAVALVAARGVMVG